MNERQRPNPTPLLDALRRCASRPHAPFYAPGHKQGRGTPASLAKLLGHSALAADLPELPELDNLFAPAGAIREAEDLAAETFGSDRARFLANGSTGGIMAAILATCNPGDKIILPRNVHRCAISGLILSGAVPVFVAPESDRHWDIAHTVAPEAIAAALAQHPEAKAILVVSPTYHGVSADLEAIAGLAHQSDIPLLVDEAHGSHFAFHSDFPKPALASGADLTVQSIHKTLAALSQAAMLHLRGTRVDRDRLEFALTLVQSTSPNYLLLASLDAARSQMARDGKALMSHTLTLAQTARTRLSELPHLAALESRHLPPGCTLDPTRLTVSTTGLGLSGFDADDILHEQLGVTAELPGHRHLTFIISLGNDQDDIDRLLDGLAALAGRSQPTPFPDLPIGVPAGSLSIPSISPREAFFAPTVRLQRDRAIGRPSAELVCPYPPGIPALMPGEIVSREAIDFLQQAIVGGGTITGCSDPSLETLTVVSDESFNAG